MISNALRGCNIGEDMKCPHRARLLVHLVPKESLDISSFHVHTTDMHSMDKYVLSIAAAQFSTGA